jgi:hypothetical protein
LLKFIPPKEEGSSFPRYASYASGELKTHRTLSGARNSLNNRAKRSSGWKQGFILESVDGEWYVLYHVPEGARYEDLPWVHKRWKHRLYKWYYYTEPSSLSLGSYTVEHYSRPMTTDEYVQWRLAVERERLGIPSS